jgi:nucleoid-associated protein YgaU
MGLLTQSLFKPVQDWIRAELGTPPGAAVVFRFDRFGTVLSDGDFTLPAHPELGYSPELATERFSDLVNRTPVDLETGEDVAFSEADIDTTYFYRLLSAAQPYLPPSLDAAGRQERIESFSVMKADALRLWEQAGNASVTGQLLEFRPSTAEPADWYDRSKAGAWQSRTFRVEGTTQAAPAAELHWRLRPDDIRVGKALDLTPLEVRQLPVADLGRRAAMIQRGEPVPAVPAAAPAPARPAAVAPRLQVTALAQLGSLSLTERILARRLILENAPTTPATTSTESTVTFDACLVRIARPWLFWPLLNGAIWYVPGSARGDVTRPGAAGALGWLPTALLAIRNFRATADWTEQDVAASAAATNFGPFALTGKIAGGVLESPALQVVGWQLERLPALPPNDAPPAAQPREYVVVKGDTLSRIALAFYGDSKRWPEIAAANHLPDPGTISVGQRLIIP